MGRKLYLNASSGISGDMFVGAMLDLGADEKYLKKILEQLPVSGFKIVVTEVEKSGIVAKDFDVVLDAEHENYDHDMKYLYETREDSNTEDTQVSQNKYRNEVEIKKEERNLLEISNIIRQMEMPQKAKEYALHIFEILAYGEARAHGTPIEKIYFHEKGAVDCIVDIVSAAVCIDNLGIEEVIIPGLCDGSGSIRCRKGIIPVPVPAVVQIAKYHQLEIKVTDIQGEMVTPTGAAIAAAIQTTKELPKEYRIYKSGNGAGKRNYNTDGILKAFLIA